MIQYIFQTLLTDSMEPLIKSLGKEIYSHNNNHKGYIVEWHLVAPICKKWSRNRDCDADRVIEMYKYHLNGGYIPHMIHVAEIIGEGLVCYDGNHRREVLNKCIADNESVPCIIDVMFGASQNDVYKAFNHINKSVQLPAIYLEDQDNQSGVKEAILEIVKKYESKYKAFMSTSARCHAPNFNRDAFVDNIHQIYKSFNGSMTISQIGDLLEKLNNEYANGNICRAHSLYKGNVIDKCKKYGFWLFLERSIPFEHFERFVNHK